MAFPILRQHLRKKRKVVDIRMQSGLTVIEVLVATAVLGIVAAMIGSVMVGTANFQSQVTVRNEANEFASAIGRYILSDMTCDSLVSGVNLPRGNRGNFVLRGYNGYGSQYNALGTGFADIQSGYEVSPRLRVQSLSVTDAGIAPHVIIIDGIRFNRRVARVELVLEGVAAEESDSMRARYYEFPVLTAVGSNQMVRCHTGTTIADACVAVGGVFDATTGRCQPRESCNFMGSYVQVTCDPDRYGCNQSFEGPSENPLTGSASCPAGSTASLTGRFSHQHRVRTGKKSYTNVTNYENFYVCVQCS